MKELSLNEIKHIEVQILKHFHNICKQENLKYTLTGGTAIGAIRHGGFIPWDDDIDVAMPRPDYEKFIQYCNENEQDTQYKLISSKDVKYSINMFNKYIDRNTYIDEHDNIEEAYKAICIDIFPIDGLGNDNKTAIKEYHSANLRKRFWKYYKYKSFAEIDIQKKLLKPFKYLLFLLSRIIPHEFMYNSIEKSNMHKDFNNSKYIACKCGIDMGNEYFPRKLFEEYIEIDFENEKFMILKEYDKYLSRLYGDYMILPPKEERISNHNFNAYLRE